MPCLQYIAVVRLKILLPLMLCLVPLFAEGGQQATAVTGVVLDASGAPIPGATVSANGLTATTNADGTFQMTAPPGRVDVQAVAPGFAPVTVTVDTPRRVRVLIKPAPL